MVTLNLNAPATRWLLVLPPLLALLGAWFAVRWYVGNTIAEYTSVSDNAAVDRVMVAVRWAPDDPLAHWRLASLEMKNFSAENIAVAVREYRLAVEASPYDFRYWVEYGRALEASGDRDGAEKALRRAVELAPAYSYPLWHYGNVLLRQGKTDEAFVQLSRAAAADPYMQPPVFGLVKQVFGDDPQQVMRVLPTTDVRIRYIIGLLNMNKFDDAAKLISTISAADFKSQTDLSNELIKTLVERRQFHQALPVVRAIEPVASQAVLESFWNGGFETNLPIPDSEPFHWLLNSRPEVRMSIDGRGHSGSRSLRMSFNAPTRLDRITASQRVIVQPESAYRVQFYQRTDNLVSAATPFVRVVDGSEDTVLASSQPAPGGTNDWQLITLDFKTKPKSQGIVIDFVRGNCSSEDPKQICPIFGTIWYDDFNLQRIGPGASRRSDGPDNR